jgi:peptidoglycan/LPS O-acetylase OafA/YrhL
LLYIGLVIFIEKDVSAKALFFANLPAFATFTTNWFATLNAPRVIFDFGWTLAAEEQFYLVWPWIERVKIGQFFSLIVVVLAVAISPDFFGAIWDHDQSRPMIFAALSRFPAAIGLGVILAHALHRPALFRGLAPVIGRRGSAGILAALLIGVLASNGALGGFEAPVLDILCVLLVGSAVIRPDNDLAVMTRVPGLVHIGIVSYGVYLMHMLAANSITLVGRSVGLKPGLLLFVATTIVAIAIASISHVTFERWIMRLRTRWVSSRGNVEKVPMMSIQPAE